VPGPVFFATLIAQALVPGGVFVVKRLALLGVALLILCAGCSNEADRGKNRDLDLPRLGEKPSTPPADKDKPKNPKPDEKEKH
jgi:hypothetical protein